MSDKKYKNIVKETVDNFSDLILDWSDSEFGSFDKWISLLKNIVQYLTKHHQNMTEIEKMDFSVKIVVELAIILYDKYTENKTEDEINELKNGKLRIIVLIINNPDILRTSVNMLNDVLKKMDADNDGKVSMKEFWSYICPCCCK